MDKLHGGLISVVSSTEFWSALVGAFVAGVISYRLFALQIRASKAERKEDREVAKAEREEERKAVHEALSRSLLFKMMRIHSNYRTLWSHLDEEKEAANKRNPKDEPFQYARPLASYPGEEHFSPDEMASLMRLGNDNLFNALMVEDQRFNALRGAFQEMDRLRSDLFKQMEAETVDEATKSTSVNLDHKLAMKLRPQMLTVNGLFHDLHAMARERYSESGRELRDLHKALTVEYGWKMLLDLEFPEEDKESTKASPPAASDATEAMLASD